MVVSLNRKYRENGVNLASQSLIKGNFCDNNVTRAILLII